MTDATIPQQLRQMDAARLRRYAENLAFYGGDQWPASMVRRQNRRLVFNYAKAIVDKTTSYLVSGLNFAVDAADDTAEAAARARAAERALAEVYDANQLDQLDFDTEIDAAILGDGAYKVTWDAAERRVRVTAPDVQGLFAWWHGDDVSRVWRVASRYGIDAESARAMYGLAAKNLQGGIAASAAAGTSARRPAVEIVEVWTAERFELWADGARIDERENPYGFIPFVIYPEHPRAEAVLGAERPAADQGADPRAEPRADAAFDDPGAVRQPDRRAGERERVDGHRRDAGRGVGAAGAGAGVPARPAAGRRREAARGLRRPGVPGDARPGRVAADGVRRQPLGAVGRGAERRAGPAAEEGAAEAADPRPRRTGVGTR